MKTFFLLCILLLTTAGTYNLAWDASPSTDVVSYNVRYGTNGSGNYTEVTNVGTNLTLCIDFLPVGPTYHIIATALSDNGLESLPSNEVNFARPLVRIRQSINHAARTLTLSFPLEINYWYQVQYVNDLNSTNWLAYTNFSGGFTNEAVFDINLLEPQKFFRIRYQTNAF